VLRAFHEEGAPGIGSHVQGKLTLRHQTGNVREKDAPAIGRAVVPKHTARNDHFPVDPYRRPTEEHRASVSTGSVVALESGRRGVDTAVVRDVGEYRTSVVNRMVAAKYGPVDGQGASD
jgi:hypothetical protein